MASLPSVIPLDHASTYSPLERRGQAVGIDTTASDGGAVLAAGVAVVALTVGDCRPAFVPVTTAVAVVHLVRHSLGSEEYVVERVGVDIREPSSASSSIDRGRSM